MAVEHNVNGECNQKFKNIDKVLDSHEKRLTDMDKSLDGTIYESGLMKGDIQSLVKSVQGLTDAIKFVGGPILIGIIGVFFYVLQNSLIK